MSAVAELPALAARAEGAPSVAPTLRAHLVSARASAAVVALTLFGVFLPVLVVPYAFSDDYPLLSVAGGLDRSAWFGDRIAATVAASGRPLAGVLDQFAFGSAATIDNLRFVRLLGVVGIVSLALVLQWALARAGIGRAAAAAVAVLCCCTPAFLVYGAWAALFNAPWAALLGAAASLLATTAAQLPGRLRVDRVAEASLPLVFALLIYQPAAMEFWVFLAVALVGAAGDGARTRRLLRAHILVAVCGAGLAFVVAKLALRLVGDAAPNPERMALTRHPLAKLEWFLHGPLYRSANLFALSTSPVLAVLVALVGAGGIALALRRRRAPLLPHLALALALLPLAFLPNLLAGEDSPTYRVLGPLSSLVVLYTCLGALGLWFALRSQLRVRLRPAALTLGAAAAAVAVAAGAAHVTMLFVLPQNTELRLLRAQVAALPSGAPRVGFVETPYRDSMSSFVSVDEFGVPSTARPWTLEPAVLLILREEGRLPPSGERPTVELLPWDTTTPPPDEPVVDVRGSLLGLR